MSQRNPLFLGIVKGSSVSQSNNHVVRSSFVRSHQKKNAKTIQVVKHQTDPEKKVQITRSQEPSNP